MAEWVRALDWRPDCPGFESHCGQLFASELWQFRLPRFASVFGGDTKSRRSLLSGVYARGSKIPHQSALECVTVVDSTAHSKLPQKCVYAAENARPALKKKKKFRVRVRIRVRVGFGLGL